MWWFLAGFLVTSALTYIEYLRNGEARRERILRCMRELEAERSGQNVECAGCLRSIPKNEATLDRNQWYCPGCFDAMLFEGDLFSRCPECEAIVDTWPGHDRLCDRCEE